MKKVVVLLLLSVLMRDGTGAGVVSPLRAADQNDNGDDVALKALAEAIKTSGDRPTVSAGNEQRKSDGSAPATTGSDGKETNGTDVAESDVRAQWTASLLARNPFIPFGTVAKKTEEKEKKSDDDWASKKADELNLQSVTEYPTYTEFSVEVISTKKRCWIRSDRASDKVPFVYVSHRAESGGDKQKKILTVKNTVTGDVMEIRQQERKKDTSRGSGGSYGGYDDYGSSYYDDDLFFDFD